MYFDAKEFGKRLHDVRTSRGITQEELAVRLGLASKQHVSRMENGERSCSIDLLIELSCMQDWPGAQKIVQEILKEDEQKKEKLHEQEVQQGEENRQSS